MDISSLKYFATVAETQHLTKASVMLNITQPGLSLAIQRIETEMGMKLFERDGRNVTLNEYGKIFLDGVNTMLSVFAETEARMRELKNIEESLVRLACPSFTAESTLTDELIAICSNLQIRNINNIHVTDILEKKIDLLIVGADLPFPELEREPLYAFKCCVFCGENHPLAGRECVSAKELQNYEFAGMHSDFALEELLRSQLERIHLFPKVSFRGETMHDHFRALRTGRYLGLSATAMGVPSDLHIIQIQEAELSLVNYLYWRKGDSGHMSISTAIQAIKRYYSTLTGPDGVLTGFET